MEILYFILALAIGGLSMAIVLYTFYIAVAKSRLPAWAKFPCSSCRNPVVRWEKNRASSSTSEARFHCDVCGKNELRGGVGSEGAMEQWERKFFLV